MPQAAAAWVALGATTFGSIVQAIIINVAIAAATKALTGKPKYDKPALNVTVRDTVANRRLIFGRRRAGGVFAFWNASSTGGSTKDILWYVVVYAGHQVSAIGDIWFDNERIPSADINGTTGVISGSTRFAGKAKIWKYLGTSAQTVNTDLDSAFTEWTSTHRLRGCAYVVVRMERSDSAFPNGAPQSVTALVDGALVYDPRLDSTNGGSGSHRMTNPSTWAFSANPALCTRWYLTGGSVHNDLTTRLIMYGCREADSRIPDSYFVAAANICDESISGVEAPPSGAQVRYSCNGEFTTGEDRRTILAAILASMAGELVYVHGQWRVYAGAYDIPTHSFSETDLYGDIESNDTTGHRERYNQVAAVFVDKDSDYVEATTIFRTDAAYETQDGGEAIPREIDLRCVTDQYQAQRLAEIELRKSRMMRVVKLRGALNWLKVAPHETFSQSHSRWGWSSRVFRCVERQFASVEDAGLVEVTARQEDAAVYADMLTADYNTGTSNTDEFIEDGPDTPTALTVTPMRDGVLLSWTIGAFWEQNGRVQVWEGTSTSFGSATMVWAGRGSTLFRPLNDRTTRYYWIRLQTPRGALSSEYPTSTTGVSGAVSTLSEWITTGTVEARGSTIRKAGGSSAWDSQARSVESLPSAGAWVRFKAGFTTQHFMLGLNSDPDTDSNWTSLDCAIYCQTGGLFDIRENGSTYTPSGNTYTTETEFIIHWTGVTVQYYKDRVLLRSVAYAPAQVWVDSSFYESTSAAYNVQYGTGDFVDIVDTGMVRNNSMTSLAQSTPADGTVTGSLITTGGSSFFSYVTLATVSMTNTLSETVSMVCAYKALVQLASANPGGCSHYLYMDVSGGATYTEATSGNTINDAVTPKSWARSGDITVSVAAGATVTLEVRLGVRVNAFSSVTPANVTYKDIVARIESIKR